jgi:hypothetical protein
MRIALKLVTGTAAAILIALFSSQARAEQEPPPSPTQQTPATTDAAPPLLNAQKTLENPDQTGSYWSRGPARSFVATSIDVGYLYLRPRLLLGYGRPFWRAIAFEAGPEVSASYLSGFAGLRATLPYVNLRLGGRYVFAFQHYFLADQPKYDRLALESQAFTRSKYIAGEAELNGTLPIGFGALIATGNITYLTGVTKDLNVYEEVLRIIVKPPMVWRGRVGYAFRLGVEGKISVGVVAEMLGSPGRDPTVRAGIIGSAALSDHVEVLGWLVPPIIGPDTIGIAGGDFGQLGIRYRAATGQAPEPVILEPGQ